jgi:hypothetical protein
MGLLIVLLGVFNLVVLLIQVLDKPGTPFPGQLLYVTTFDAYNQQWSMSQGQMRTEIANGALHVISDSVNDGLYSALDRVLTDFDLRVDAQWLKAQSNDSQIGIVFRYQDRKNYYVFRIRGDGAYRVELVNDGNVGVLSEWQISPSIKTALNQVNHLRVVGKSFQFQFYVDDQLLLLCLKGQDKKSTWTGLRTGQCASDNKRTREELVDMTLSQGEIALGAVSGFSDAGVEVAFYNVSIVGPQ